MKKTYLSLATAFTLAAIFFVAPVRAQRAPALITSTITSRLHDPGFSMGRDFWFAEQSNYWGENLGGKYMRIYITSAKNCTAYVASQGVTATLKITAFKITNFLVPESWEMESSGVPEGKAIHVYSSDGDLSVYNMSHNDYSSDGEYVIPTIGWGSDYVVAAYESYFDGWESDLSSTMAVVADQDNTTVQVTPSCDCRLCTSGNLSGNAQAFVVAFPMGVTQTFTLNRGYSLQLMPINADDEHGFDLTGTIVHSNVPVGVLGGSMCPNIPAAYPYGDRVEDMIPPIRTGGETYYTTSFAQPPQSTDDFAQYLFISTVTNQTILRHSCDSGTHTECVIPNQYGIYWDELALGQKFWSDQPFLVVEYHNSTSYPDGNTGGEGGPAEVHLNPREQFTDTILFQIPQTFGNEQPYYNYANVFCNVKDANNIYFDNKKISGIPSQCVDGNWEIFTVTNVAPGLHTILGSDSGVGVDAYGYGTYETYAWSSPASVATFQSQDTIAPKADTSGACYHAYVHVTDSGRLPGGDTQSGLAEIRLDSIYNMDYILDADWLDGRGVDSAGYGMFVVNPDDSAILVVSIFDMAGNRTTVRSTYHPQVAAIEPPIKNIGVYFAPTTKIGYDTLINQGTAAFDIDTMFLKYGNVGFSIYDSTGGPLDLSPLAPGKRRLIKIEFIDPNSQRQVDSIIYGNLCGLKAVAVIGSGGAADFFVADQTWPHVLLTNPPTCYLDSVQIENLSPNPITIDSATWSDKVHFHAVSTFPFTLPPSPASYSFTVDYCPDSASLVTHNGTQGIWYSPQVLTFGKESPRFDSLTAWAIASAETFGNDTVIVTSCSQQGDTIPITFTITETGTAPMTIAHVYQSNTTDFFGLTGTLPSGDTWLPDTGSQGLQPGQSATITVYYVVPTAKDTTVVDSLTVVDGNGDTIATTDGKTVKATVITNYYAGITIPRTLTFGPTLFQAPGILTKTFIIQNTAASGLAIDNISLQGELYQAAYTITTVPSFPDTLLPGQSMTVTVTFNDSISDDPVQLITPQISSSNSCVAIQESMTAYLSNSSVQETMTPPLGASVITMDDARSLEIILPPNITAPANFELVNVLGESVLRAMLSGGNPAIDASGLPRGVYFYRITAGHESQSGKVLLGE